MTTYTKEQEPELFELIWDDRYHDESYDEHRKGSTRFVQWIFDLTDDEVPEKYRGFWESNQFIWSDIDYDKNDVTELTKVEKVKKIIEQEEWVKAA